MRYSSRLFLYAPFLLLIVLAVAAMLRWWAVAAAFESWLIRANGREISPGVMLRFASEETGGFPFRVDTVLGNVAVEARCVRTSLSWRTEHFAIHSLTYGRGQRIFEAGGMQSLSWTNSAGATRRFVFTPGSLRASAILSDGALARFDLDAAGFGSRELSGARAQLHVRRAPSRDMIDIAMSTEALRLAPELQAGFGPELPHMIVQGRIVPAAPFSQFLSGRDHWCAAVDKWRTNAGSLHLDHFDVTWGKTSAEGSGRLTLDHLHRPEGALQLKVAGPQHLFAFGERQLAVTFGRLARNAKSRGVRPFDVSVVLDDGVVSVQGGRKPHAESATAGTIDALY